MRSPNTRFTTSIRHQDVSCYSLPGYCLDALCWAWLGWVVASQSTGGDWLEPTYACLEIEPLSPSVFLSLLHPTQHSAVFIQLTHENILHEKKKLPAPMTEKKILKSGHQRKRERAKNQRSCNETKRKVRNRCRSAQTKSRTFVFCLPIYLVSQLFWRISICYWAFVEGFRCPPTHFSHTTHPRPFPASLSLSLPDKFFPPSHSTQPASPFCGCACLVWSECGACRASLHRRRKEEEKKKKLFVSYGNTMRQTQALINYTVHLHIPGIRHYAKYALICIMDSSCCLKCPVAAFYLIMKKQKCKKRRRIACWCPIKPSATTCLKQQIEKDFEENTIFVVKLSLIIQPYNCQTWIIYCRYTDFRNRIRKKWYSNRMTCRMASANVKLLS